MLTLCAVTPASDDVPLVLLSAVVGQLTGRQSVDAGDGCHALVAVPDAVHVYVCAVGPATAPVIVYPLAHVMLGLCVVVPTSDVPLVLAIGVVGHETAWQKADAGDGDHTLAPGPEPLHVYVCVDTVLAPPPIE